MPAKQVFKRFVTVTLFHAEFELSFEVVKILNSIAAKLFFFSIHTSLNG